MGAVKKKFGWGNPVSAVTLPSGADVELRQLNALSLRDSLSGEALTTFTKLLDGDDDTTGVDILQLASEVARIVVVSPRIVADEDDVDETSAFIGSVPQEDLNFILNKSMGGDSATFPDESGSGAPRKDS